MARKSRKNSSHPESAAQIGQVSYVTAIYARLSVENSGKQDEGASLQNQIDVCKEYEEKIKALLDMEEDQPFVVYGDVRFYSSVI